MILPGKELAEGHTYIVALRNLRNCERHGPRARRAGSRSCATAAGCPPTSARSAARYDEDLHGAEARRDRPRQRCTRPGTSPSAPRQNLTSRLLSIRNNAFAQLGDHNLADGRVQGSRPASRSPSNLPRLDPTLRDVQGTFQVPCYLITCGPTATTGLPLQLEQARRHCRPRSPATSPRRSSSASSRPRRPRRTRRGSRCTATACSGRTTRSTDSWVQALATGLQHGVLRDRLVGAGPGRLPARGDGGREPEPVPGDRRPPPAGRAEHAVPGPADAQPAGASPPTPRSSRRVSP